MKKYKAIKSLIGLVSAIVFTGFYTSCSSDFLNEDVYGEVDPSEMTNEENVEATIISAYSILNGQMDDASNAYNSPASNWSFGDVLADDCYKGGGGTGDQSQIHTMELYNTDATTLDVERKWLALYEGVKRVNTAMQLLDASEDYTDSDKSERMGELYFLRGHFYFELKKIYDNVPYIDETATSVEDYKVSNLIYSSDSLWGLIETNFKLAYNSLPDEQEDVGRPTKIAAKAYLAKCYLFQSEWQKTYNATEEVMSSDNYGLMDDFQDVFLPENDNCKEIIFAVQASVNDGQSSNYNGCIGDRLNTPGGDFYPQYGFHRPSQNLVNAFKTDSIGMPIEDNENVTSDDYVDPRVDITLARQGIPYKDLGVEYDTSWARAFSTYGEFETKKRIISANSEYYISEWPYVSSLNYYVIRYAEVVLWRAEAAAELGELEEARSLVNEIRERAANSEYVMNLEETDYAANYKISTYNEAWTDQDEAIDNVRLETRLELAMEGHRFFNLVRWGVAAEVIDEYLTVEKTRHSHLTNASFTEGKNEYMPIPQDYIDQVGEDLVQQNDGY